MAILLSSMIGLAMAWLTYLFAQRVEQEHFKVKWFANLKAIQEEGALLLWNKPLISLTTPFFKKGVFKKTAVSPDFLSWIFWMTIEMSLVLSLLFGFTLKPVLLGALFGFIYPWAWRLLKKRERIRSIRKDLPLVMDLLAISVAAGLDIMQALQKIVKALPRTALLKEFEEMLQDLKLGRTRKEALTLLKERIPLIEIRNLVSLLLQTIQLGSPLAPVLLASADQMRMVRLIHAEKLGIQASQKVLFPLIFCILPSVILTIFAPLLIRWFTGGFENLI